jgi:hypothetical protein
MFSRSILPCVLMMCLSQAYNAAETVAESALATLQAANNARSEKTRVEAEWQQEKQRLLAIIATTQAEQQRVQQALHEAGQQQQKLQTELAALGDSAAAQAETRGLQQLAQRIKTILAEGALLFPPGSVAVMAEQTTPTFEASLRALEASERAAETQSIDIITGERAGRIEAVKMLRVSGAAAWWVSLNGHDAGIVRMQNGIAQLIDVREENERAAIQSAILQAEGRKAPALVVLPLGAQP